MHIIYDIKSKIASELAGFGFDSSSWQLNLSTAQNVFSKFRPDWWQFCWMTGVKFNSIQSILVRFLHITQFTVCAAKNLTVFVADSPRCLEWSSMVVAVSRALRELSEPCLGWTREPRRQPKSLGARRQYSATGNNVLPVMTGSPAFLTRPPPANCSFMLISLFIKMPKRMRTGWVWNSGANCNGRLAVNCQAIAKGSDMRWFVYLCIIFPVKDWHRKKNLAMNKWIRKTFRYFSCGCFCMNSKSRTTVAMC